MQVRGGIKKKKLVFFYFLSNRGGGLGEYKKSLSENTKTFLTRGGSYPIQKGFFGIIYQKRGVFIKKMVFF